MALLLLLTASLAGLPGSVLAQSGDCGLVVAQDDARSGRDAGATPDDAVELTEETVHAASISYPHGPVVDTEDWFQASWSDDSERRVMVNVTTRALGLSYFTPAELPAPPLELEAYAPGAEEPTFTAERDDGVARLDFQTDEPGTWSFRVALPGVTATDACPASQRLDAPGEAQSYNLYWGCHPHCLTVG